MPEPVNRTALFDPGKFSQVDVESLAYLDDIIITHGHFDHFDAELVAQLKTKFPDVRITAPDDVVEQLDKAGIAATSATSEGIELFNSPHEQIRPFFDADAPQEIGVHYLGKLSHPGDSHSFSESKAILALPVQAPWGSPNAAVQAAIDAKPQYIIPIHDYQWGTEGRQWYYDGLEQVFKGVGITFIRPTDGEAFVLDV
jgi:L-ascorbate metabolism protein UlaG (beta-lactamase superfamily)